MSNVTIVAGSYNGLNAFAADNETLQIFNTTDYKRVGKIETNSELVICESSRDDLLLFLKKSDSTLLEIYGIKSCEIIYTIEDFTSNIMYITLDSSVLFWIGKSEENSGSKLVFTSLKNLEKISHITLDINAVDFAINSDENQIIITDGKKSDVLTNPLKTNVISVFGDDKKMYEFIDYISSVIENKSKQYNGAYDDWIIEPFHLNPLHIYANYNQSEYLGLAITNNSPFFPSRTGDTPLSVAIQRNYNESINVIFRELKRKLERGNNFAFYYVGESIIDLNKIGFENLHRIYELALKKSNNIKLPKFVAEYVKIPIVVHSPFFQIEKDDFPQSTSFTEEGTAIAFAQSLFALSLLPGSTKSLELLSSIIECPNESIYNTRIIKTILETKWVKLRWFLYLQAILYAAYLGLLGVFSIYFSGEENGIYILILPFVVSLVLTIYEFVQMYNSGWDYFGDKWNYIDILRGTLFNSYCVILWSTSITIGDLANMLTICVFISWIRGITYFRLFDATRYLITLLTEVVKDIIPFFILLFYSTFAFAFIHQTHPEQDDFIDPDNQTGPFGFFEYFDKSYKENLGELSGTTENLMSWAIFIIVSIINPIIMLNMLISIMGDTYGRVKEARDTANARELAGMIQEVENLMYWNKDYESKEYIKICCEASELETGNTDSILRKIRGLKDVITTRFDRLETLIESKQSENPPIN